jgi:transposase-like protein
MIVEGAGRRVCSHFSGSVRKVQQKGGPWYAWKALLRTMLQEELEAEIEQALRAGKGERTGGRLGYRSGYYPRTLVKRVGTLELRVPQDR